MCMSVNLCIGSCVIVIIFILLSIFLLEQRTVPVSQAVSPAPARKRSANAQSAASKWNVFLLKNKPA